MNMQHGIATLPGHSEPPPPSNPRTEMETLRDGIRPTGLRRLGLATLNSLRGLRVCYRSEDAFRQEVWAAGIAVPADRVA